MEGAQANVYPAPASFLAAFCSAVLKSLGYLMRLPVTGSICFSFGLLDLFDLGRGAAQKIEVGSRTFWSTPIVVFLVYGPVHSRPQGLFVLPGGSNSPPSHRIEKSTRNKAALSFFFPRVAMRCAVGLCAAALPPLGGFRGAMAI